MKIVMCLLIVAATAIFWWPSAEPEAPPTDAGAGRQGSPASPETSADSGAESRQPERERMIEETDAIAPGWLVQLLYGPGNGAAGYTEVRSGLRAGRLTIECATTVIVSELVADNGGPAQLRNTELVAAILYEDLDPSAGVVDLRNDYVASKPASGQHAEMMILLHAWPADERTCARVAKLIGELGSAGQRADMMRIMRDLLALGPVGAKALTSHIVDRTSEGMGEPMWLVVPLLDTTTDKGVLSMLLHDAAATQWDEGVERTARPVHSIGVAVRLYLSDLVQDSDHARWQSIRTALMATGSEQTVKNSSGLGVAIAICLGGSKQEDPEVAGFLARGSQAWPPLAANAALVNLGYATDPASYLQYVPGPLTPPKGREQILRHADYLAGLALALQRHPDQADLVLPYIAEALRSWRSSRFEITACQAILQLVKKTGMRSAEGLLRELRDSNHESLSRSAGKILESWK